MKVTPVPAPAAVPSPVAGADTDEETCLVSATRLDDFITFVRERAIGGREHDRGELAQTWRDAASHFCGLEISEAASCDKPQVLPLPGSMQAHVDRLVKLPTFNNSFATVPVAFGLVELDKLVVYQQYITQSSVDALAAGLSRPPGDDDLVRLCLPLEAPTAGFRLARQDGEKFVFVTDSHDGRFLGAQLIDPARIDAFVVNGHPSSVLALPFGFTTNVLNVVRYGSRMVLNNGYHRAAALRRLGVTHAPCIIQVCAHWEDVAVAGAGAISRNADLYFSHPRPPMLRDFFNPLLARTFRTHRLRKEIRVTFEIDTLKLAI